MIELAALNTDLSTLHGPDGTITDGEVKMTMQEIMEMIERAGFEAVERDTVYNKVASA
jgi:2-iminoacetate synthase ThiH